MTRGHTSRRAWVALLLLVVLAGCGPTVGLSVGMKEPGASVYFGQPTPRPAATLPPVAQLNPVPNFPAPLEAPPNFESPTLLTPPPPAPPATACPTAPPGAVLASATVPTPTGPPVNTAAPYAFRYSGLKRLDPGQHDEKDTQLPATGLRSVTGAAMLNDGSGGYTFAVQEQFNGVYTTNTFIVYPYGPSGSMVSSQTSTQPQAGLYLQRMESKNYDGSNDSTFTPEPPVLLMPLPANTNIGTVFQGAGVDAQTEKSMVLPPMPGSAINGDAHVDACGALLDSWQVTVNGSLVDSRLAGQTTSCPAGAGNTSPTPGCTPFTLVLDIGTQYGAISLADDFTENSIDQATNKPFTYHVNAIINETPA